MFLLWLRQLMSWSPAVVIRPNSVVSKKPEQFMNRKSQKKPFSRQLGMTVAWQLFQCKWENTSCLSL